MDASQRLYRPRDPVLKPLDTIECRDAVLTPEGGEPEWPAADVVVGNPPFLGGKLLITTLGEDYVAGLFRVYEGRVPAEADLVCYWFVKAGEQAETGRVGLVSTNSIRGGANRRALQAATRNRKVFEAWNDEPWVIDGAAVRVSLVCFSRPDDESVSKPRLNGELVDEIYTDLTARLGETGVDLTTARRLLKNANRSFQGCIKVGPFDIPGDLARQWLQLPANANGRPNTDVLKPWINGQDITRRPTGKWIIDFGWTMPETEAALYEAPFQWTQEHVYPARQNNRRERRRKFWWRHGDPVHALWKALDGVSRYIATPRVAKYRLFVWCDVAVCPDSAVIAIARSDDTTFGILHSRFHEGVVAAARHVAWGRQRPTLHANHYLRVLSLPRRPVPRRSRSRVRQRPTRNRHRRCRPTPGRTARPLAQPARMGGMDRRAGSRLSETPGPRRRGGSQATQETHPNQPL